MTQPDGRRVFGRLAGLLLLGMAAVWAGGCTGPAPITPELYKDALSVQTKRAGDKLMIATRVGPAAPGYYEYRKVLVSTGGPPIFVDHGEGILGDVPRVGALSVGPIGKEKIAAADVKEVIVQYQVFQGDSRTGTPLFEGEYRKPVDP